MIFGFGLAVVIGLTLGLLGGGGSILTVPVFKYVFGIAPLLATAYSLFTVGATSIVGAWRASKFGNVNFKVGIIFGIPSIISVYLTRKYLMPSMPEELFTIGNYVMTRDVGLMVFFAVIMILASISMIRGRKEIEALEAEHKLNIPLIFIEGAVVGMVTGIVGAGGGFLIVPALVLIAKLDIKKAVGTSLLIISAKSLIGFLGDVQEQPNIDWKFLLIFTALSIIGIFIGIAMAKKVPAKKLKKGFGYFLIVMGAAILGAELL